MENDCELLVHGSEGDLAMLLSHVPKESRSYALTWMQVPLPCEQFKPSVRSWILAVVQCVHARVRLRIRLDLGEEPKASNVPPLLNEASVNHCPALPLQIVSQNGSLIRDIRFEVACWTMVDIFSCLLAEGSREPVFRSRVF